MTKFCFIAKFNYIFRTQYPWHTERLLPAFDELQGDIALSLFNEDIDHYDENITNFVGEATKLSTRLGGLGLREQHITIFSAFISSITTCVYDLSRTFPSYIQAGGQREISISTVSQKSTGNWTNPIIWKILQLNQ